MAKKKCEYVDCNEPQWAHGACNRHRHIEELPFDEETAADFWEFVKKELNIG